MMAGTTRKEHWDLVYATKGETGVSWFQAEPRLSLAIVRSLTPIASGRIIDVGGGASVLVDRLVDFRFAEVAVLDVSALALEKARLRLGGRNTRVRWMVADVTEIADLGTFDVWHDRAVFHFLTTAADRRKYVALATRTVPVGGHVIIGMFSLDGPGSCSGLPVKRYNAAGLATEFGPAFTLLRELEEVHLTPQGSQQPFAYAVLRRVPSPY